MTESDEDGEEVQRLLALIEDIRQAFDALGQSEGADLEASDKSARSMTEGHDPQVIELADAIVEMYRRIYAFDLDLNHVSAEFWREQQAKGVGRETYNAAKLLARPRVDALFQDYVRALPGGVMEALVGRGSQCRRTRATSGRCQLATLQCGSGAGDERGDA